MAHDPVNQNVFWAIEGETGHCWKSTDFGAKNSWTKVSTGSPGLRWVIRADPDITRNPATPPKLVAVGPFGLGIAISTDGGENWTNYNTDNTVAAAAGGSADWGNDCYDVRFDPTNSNHLICTFHAQPGLSESTDGGENWTTITTYTATHGTSLYCDFGYPAPSETGKTVSDIWYTISQWGGTTAFTRTNDAGTTINVISTLAHAHGNAVMLFLPDGTGYAAGHDGATGDGIYRTADFGLTFTEVLGVVEGAIYRTPQFFYADYGWATTGSVNPNLRRSFDGITWGTYTTAPAEMTNGSMQGEVGYDSVRDAYVIVTSNWGAGLFRYYESSPIIGSALGSSTATAVGASQFRAVGNSTSTSIVTAVGAPQFSAPGATTASATVTAVGATQFRSVGNATSAASVDATATAAGTGVAAASGSTIATAVGAAQFHAVGNALSVATVAATADGASAGTVSSSASVVGVGHALMAGTASASGVAVVTGIGTAQFRAVGNATAAANAAGFSPGDLSIGDVSGSSTVAGVGASQFRAEASAAGISTVTAVGAALAQGIGNATSSATGGSASDTAGAASGSATVFAVSQTLALSVGFSVNISSASGVMSMLAHSVGIALSFATVTGISGGITLSHGWGGSVREIGGATGRLREVQQ
jgi:hypothetical protein